MLTIINDTINNPHHLTIQSNDIHELLSECSLRFHVNHRIYESLMDLGFAFINALEGNGQVYNLKLIGNK